jgi:hypothetical protein
VTAQPPGAPEGASTAVVDRRERRLLHHPDLPVAALGAVLAVGVCWPLFGGRPLFLLDWVTGPHPPFPSPAMLGLDGGLTAGLAGGVLMTLLVRTFGEAVTWLVLFAVFPLAALGAGRLAGRGRWCRMAAGTLYAVNPFVFNRVFAGQLALLVGYALLPWAVASALRATGALRLRRPTAWAGPALWWGVLTALSPHFAWIFGVVLLAVVVVSRPWSWWLLAWLAATVGVFVLLSLYILLPHSATELPTRVGATSLALYRTQGSRRFGLFVNVLGLYGFWRLGPGPVLPKNEMSGWPLVLAALLVVVAVGYVTRLRRTHPDHRPARPAGRRLAWLGLTSGVAGYFLALGSQGPTGPLFSWVYFHVFFFQVMREPQKFLMLTALAYAMGFGWGVERLLGRDRQAAVATEPRPWASRASWTGALGLAVVLPLVYTPTIFDGLAGQIAPSTIPSAYQQANRLMGRGPGRVLYLPWHLYEAQPFTQERVVATPGPTLFDRTVLAGDNVQIGPVQTQSTSPRSAYIERLLAAGPRLRAFGADVAPLGVQWVVLAKTVDWRDDTWLAQQPDLRLVLDDRTLELFRNLAYHGVGQRTGATAPVRQVSLVAYRIPPGQPGRVTIDAAYQPGWVLDGVAGRPTRTGTVAFDLPGRAGGLAVFTPWRLVRLGAVLSGAVGIGLGVLVLVDRRRSPHETKSDQHRRDSHSR